MSKSYYDLKIVKIQSFFFFQSVSISDFQKNWVKIQIEFLFCYTIWVETITTTYTHIYYYSTTIYTHALCILIFRKAFGPLCTSKNEYWKEIKGVESIINMIKKGRCT